MKIAQFHRHLTKDRHTYSAKLVPDNGSIVALAIFLSSPQLRLLLTSVSGEPNGGLS